MAATAEGRLEGYTKMKATERKYSLRFPGAFPYIALN
jgi:hypothetical protein